MAKKKLPVTIKAALIGAVAVIVGAILTPYVQDKLDRDEIPIETQTQTVSTSTTAPPLATIMPTATDSPVVLSPTWIDREGSVLVLDNQVLIHIEKQNLSLEKSVNISVTTGITKQNYSWIRPGERVVFQYLGVDYSVTVMQIIGVQTQISVERILDVK